MTLTNAIANATESAIMKLIFQAVTWTDYAISAGSGTPETNIVCSLHTADPGEAGTMSTSETTYTTYARTNVARTSGGWTETSGSISPVSTISFPTGSGGSGSVTHFATGKSGGGAAAILWRGDVTPPISVGASVTPQLLNTTTITID